MLVIESSKITEKIIRENAFEHKKKKPGLSANRPSNNWAMVYHYRVSSVSSPLELFQTHPPPHPPPHLPLIPRYSRSAEAYSSRYMVYGDADCTLYWTRIV